MARKGPIPMRSEALADPSRAGRDRSGESGAITKGTALPVKWPRVPKDWDPIAKMLYKSAQESGQAAYYQQTDIALLYSLCDDMTKYKEGRPKKDRHGNVVYDEETGEPVLVFHRSPEMLKALLSGFASLLISEGDRRRARIELETPTVEVDAQLVAIDDYRKQLGA